MPTDHEYPQAVLLWLDSPQPALLAQRSLRLWQAIHDELSPLMGTSGFITLYGRCVDLSGVDRPWLRKAPARSAPAACFDLLAAQLAARAPAEAQAAGRDLFATFYDLLLLLIGAALTAGVLNAAWRDRLRCQPLLIAVTAPPNPQ